MRRRRHVPAPTAAHVRPARDLPALLIALAAFVCMGPALHAAFVNWDDHLTFTENPHYRGLSPTHLAWMLTTTHLGQYRPLTWLTYGLDYTIWGMNPTGYHLTNMLLHAANGVVLYALLVLLLERVFPASPRVRAVPEPYGAAALGALFFAIHPLRVEAVAWATERQEVLCGLFFLLSVLAYVQMLDPQRCAVRSRRTWYWVSIGCFALSLLSKPAGLTLPLVLLVLDAYPLGRLAAAQATAGSRWRVVGALLVEKIPYVVLAVAALVAAFVAKQPAALVPFAEHGLTARVAQAAYGLCFYLWKTVAPVGLSPLYLLERPLHPTAPKYVVSALVAAVVTAVAVRYRHRWPWGLATWVSYVVLAAPVLGFAQNGVQVAADRYTYVACLPWAVLLAAGVHRLRRAWHTRPPAPPVRLAVLATVTVTLALFALRTYEQAAVWRDSLTLWNRVLEVEPANYVAYNNRGNVRQLMGDVAGAIADYDQAIRFDPGYASAYTNRGYARQVKGDLDGALADCERAIGLDPENPEVRYNCGNARKAKGDLAGALADYSETIRLNPAHVGAYANRGNARQASGDLDGARRDYDTALALQPGSAMLYNNRAAVHRTQGHLDAAIADFTTALRLEPTNGIFYANRGAVRQAAGDLNGALSDYTRAIELAPPATAGRAALERAVATVRSRLTAGGNIR
jgi:tetratricopeptide (TPR) repeat protein